MPKILTLDEACELLRVAKPTVYEWRTKGEGPPFFKYSDSKGAPLFILDEDLNDWVKEQARATNQGS